MNCKTGRNHVLLANSGEISSRHMSSLEKHLAVCGSCREYRRQVEQMLSDMARLNPGAEPAEAVLAGIRRAAANEDNHDKVRLFAPAWGFAACAAALVLALVGLHTLRPSGHDAQTEQLRIAQIGDLMEILSDEELSVLPEDGDPDATGLDMLAERLLRFQGLNIDERACEDLMFAEDTHSTDLQSRSTRVSPQAEYV